MIINVGVGVVIFNKTGKILLGKRIGRHGGGTWAFPGGHLDHAESPFDCARRETDEETGLSICNLKRGPWISTLFDEHTHYLTLFVIAQHEDGEPAVLEPHKCAEWRWFDWESFPHPLFKATDDLIAHYPQLDVLKAYQ
ncbi:MAG: NUDIX domain-containing protein [Gammaproteobacteria bacterium]|nr:NUDIX domain-containing protein [Gammaproteobacteria bacterium]